MTCLPVTPMATTPAARPTTAARVSDAIMAAYNEADTDRIDDVFADDFVCHLPGGGEVHGPDGYKARIEATLAAFPDFHKEEVLVVGDDEQGAVMYRWRGTHEGEFMGIAPTENRVETTSVGMLRFEDGKLAAMWAYSDGETLKQQLGVAE